MKQKISILLVIVLLVNINTTNVFAETNRPFNKDGSVYLSAEEKTEFQISKDKEYKKQLKHGLVKQSDKDYIEALMLEANSFYSDKSVIYSELEEYGCYVINPSDDEIVTFSDASDIYLSTPTIYYNAYNMTWTVTCGGNWTNNRWSYDNPFLGSVGGQDGFGVGFTQVSGNNTGAVVSASAYLYDGISTYSSTSYRSDGDGSKGFGFRLQDYTRLEQSTMLTRYVGHTFSGLCNYDRYFGSMSGIATAYYIHTWSSATISSVSFGIEGKTAGINATISGSSNSFIAYSADRRFGVY